MRIAVTLLVALPALVAAGVPTSLPASEKHSTATKVSTIPESACDWTTIVVTLTKTAEISVPETTPAILTSVVTISSRVSPPPPPSSGQSHPLPVYSTTWDLSLPHPTTLAQHHNTTRTHSAIYATGNVTSIIHNGKLIPS